MSATMSVLKKADGVKTGFQSVTPEMAIKWLEGNTHNRPIRQTVVNRYAADMKAGRWRQTHQGIAFDQDGTLIDGQHRLYAIMESATTVLLMVTWGLPLDSQMVVDDGIKRNVVDILKINGTQDGMESMTALHAAVARRMKTGLVSRDRGDTTQATRLEQGVFLTRHWDAISFAVGQFPMRVRIPGISASPIAAIARAYYHEEIAQLVRFSQVLHSGMPQKPSDEVIIVLRNWLLAKKKSGGDAGAIESYAKTLRALKAFLEGRTIPNGKLYGVSEDPYPLPVKNVRFKTTT